MVMQQFSVVGAAGETFVEVGRTFTGTVKSIAYIFSPSGVRNFVDAFSSHPSTTSSDTNNTSGSSSSGSASNSFDPNKRAVGVVGMVRLGGELVGRWGVFLYFVGTVNLSIGFLNLIPLLPFDGGHVAIATYERIRSRKGKRYVADLRKMMPLVYAVVLVLFVMMAGILWLDIRHPIGG
jgi:membrane-associated protease RseP (regulator of RpoE activity)